MMLNDIHANTNLECSCEHHVNINTMVYVWEIWQYVLVHVSAIVVLLFYYGIDNQSDVVEFNCLLIQWTVVIIWKLYILFLLGL